MYDHVASTEITLCNTGKVGFDFCCLNLDPALAKKPKPGVPIMVPHAVSHTHVQLFLKLCVVCFLQAAFVSNLLFHFFMYCQLLLYINFDIVT